MAWVLSVNGAFNPRRYVSLTTPVVNPIPVGGSLRYVGVNRNTNSLGIFIDVYNGSGTDIIAMGSSGQIRVRIDNTLVDGTQITNIGDWLELLIERTATQYIITVNGVEDFRITKTADMDTLKGIQRDNFNTWMETNTLVLNNGLTDTLKLDADASDHSNTGLQPVLVDTIGGNNATGVNFPTDGSAWIDLGGGGVVSADVSVAAKKPTVLIQGDATTPAVTADVFVLAKKPTVSIDGSATTPQLIADISVTAKKPFVFIQGGPTLPNPTANINITAKKPIVSVFADVEISPVTANINVTAKKPIVFITGEPLVNAVTADINVTTKKPMVSVTGSVTLPNPIADISITAKKPVVQISATVSGLILKAPEAARLVYKPGSNKLNYDVASNQITYNPGSNRLTYN